MSLENIIYHGSSMAFVYPVEDLHLKDKEKSVIPTSPGIYFLSYPSYFENVRHLYIGSSRNLRKRLNTHHGKLELAVSKGATHCEVILLPYPLCWGVEQLLIDRYKPLLNDVNTVWWNDQTEKVLRPELHTPPSTAEVPCIMGAPKDLADCQARLKKANSKVRVISRGKKTKLCLEATLPAKPNSRRFSDHQQRITLGLSNNKTGLKLAEIEAMKLSYLLQTSKFHWSQYPQALKSVRGKSNTQLL